MHTIIKTVIFALAFLLPTVWSLPLVIRDAVAPPITNPDASTVWKVGDTVRVTWDTSGLPPPANVTNPTVRIILGFLEGTDENLMFDTPLAQGISIFNGTAVFSVPNVPPKDNYIVCVFGDSGNISPTFSITGGTVETSSTSVVSETSKVTPVPPITTAPFPSSATSLATTTAPVVTGSTITSGSTPSVSSVVSTPASNSNSVSSSTSLAPTASALGANEGNNNAAWSSKQVQLTSLVFSALLAFALL